MKKLIAVLAVLVILASGFAISPLLAGDVVELDNPLPYCEGALYDPTGLEPFCSDGAISGELVSGKIPRETITLEDILFVRYGVTPVFAELSPPIPQGMSGLSPIHFNRQPTPEEYYWLLMHFRDLRR